MTARGKWWRTICVAAHCGDTMTLVIGIKARDLKWSQMEIQHSGQHAGELSGIKIHAFEKGEYRGLRSTPASLRV
jgi:hypothetical protein